MKIREAEVSDAKNVLSLMLKLDTETKFMLLEPTERVTTLEQQTSIINSLSESQNKVMMVISEGTKILGFALGLGNDTNRNKHSMSCVIGIQNENSGQGLGKKLMLTLEKWAKERCITRMELTVMCHNDRAKSLYGSCGFEVEGIKRNSMLVDGEYINEVYMSKLLTA